MKHIDEASNGKMTNNKSRTNHYDMMQNAAGEILLIIDYEEEEPHNPRIVHDGGSDARFYRNIDSAMTIHDLDQQAARALSEVDEVLLIEVKNDDVSRKYKVPVRHIKSLEALKQ